MALAPLVICGRVSDPGDNKRGAPKYFTVYNAREKVSYTCCSHPDIFCFIREGDSIVAICQKVSKVDSIIPSRIHTLYNLLKQPTIIVPTSKADLLRCFVNALKWEDRSFNDRSALGIYDGLARHGGIAHDDSDRVASHLSNLADEYKKTTDLAMLAPLMEFIKGTTTTLIGKLLGWWNTNYCMRRLWCMGLSTADIEQSGMSSDLLYQRCINNPYAIAKLPIDKCNSIMACLGRTPKTDDVICGNMIRLMSNLMTNVGFTAIPLRMVSQNFGDITPYLEKLRVDFDVSLVEFPIRGADPARACYFSFPLKVEVELVAAIAAALAAPKEVPVSPVYRPEYNYTDDQKAAITGALNNQLAIITGGAGTGKTTIIAEIVHNITLLRRSYRLIAYTGKAASRIRNVVKQPATTIHRFLMTTKRWRAERKDPPVTPLLLDYEGMLRELAEAVRKEAGTVRELAETVRKDEAASSEVARKAESSGAVGKEMVPLGERKEPAASRELVKWEAPAAAAVALTMLGELRISRRFDLIARLYAILQAKKPLLPNWAAAVSASDVPAVDDTIDDIFIDEASMLNAELFYELITTMKRWQTKPFRLILVGDINQLPPIAWGSVMSAMMASKRVPIYRLTVNHRFNRDPAFRCGITINANNIIHYRPEIGPFAIEQTQNFIFRHTANDEALNSIKALIVDFKRANAPIDQVTILTPYNRDLHDLNMAFKAIYLPGQVSRTDIRGNNWGVGDRVAQTENDYNIDVMNGEEGRITEVRDTSILVAFPNGVHEFFFPLTVTKEKRKRSEHDGNILLERKDAGLSTATLLHCFASTVHRSQGSEFFFTIIYLPSMGKGGNHLNLSLLYTAVTRARKACVVLSQEETYANAATNPIPFRCEYLSRRLVDAIPYALEEGESTGVPRMKSETESEASTLSGRDLALLEISRVAMAKHGFSDDGPDDDMFMD